MVLVAACVFAATVLFISYQSYPAIWRRMAAALFSPPSLSASRPDDDRQRAATAQKPAAAGRRPAAGLSAAHGSGLAGFEDSRHLQASTKSDQKETGRARTPTTIMVTADIHADRKPAGQEEEEEGDGQTTPKASAATNGSAAMNVPTLSLAVDRPPPPSPSSLEQPTNGIKSGPKITGAPVATSSGATSTSSLPAKRPSQSCASSLMPPPPVRPSSLRPLPRLSNPSSLSSSSSSLNPPPSAASSLRLPGSRGAPNSLAASARNPSLSATAASTSTLPPSARPSRKVILPPGHSPLDWAALCRAPPSATFLRGADVPPDGRLLKVSPRQLRHYNGRKGRDAWGTYQGRVYNLTPYRDFHPGGVQELMRGAGRPGETERLFKEVHPWVNWDGMLAECLVGVLVGEGEGEGEGGAKGATDLDAMD